MNIIYTQNGHDDFDIEEVETIETASGDRFTFNTKTHHYTLNGSPLTGVTTILGVLAKPFLDQWRVDEAIRYLKEHGKQLKGGIKVTEDDFVNASNAHKAKRDKAAEQGTDTHAQIEELVNLWIENNDGYVLPTIAKDKQVQDFVNWARDNKIKFLASEKRIYSKEWWCGGTCDLILEKDGKLMVGDIKTGKMIANEAYYQTSAYAKMLVEMGVYDKIQGTIIIRLGKSGDFEVDEDYNLAGNQKLFNACVDIYRQQKLTDKEHPKKWTKNKY